MQHLASLPATALIGTLLTACVLKPAPSHELAESEWEFVSIDESRPAETGSIRFEGARLSADIGCNSMDGDWRIEGERLIAGPLETSEVACADMAALEQERALFALLVAAPRLEVQQDRLVLRSSGHRAELRRVSPRRQS